MPEDDANQTLMPTLRFPEFRDSWETASLADVAEFVNEKTPIAKVAVANYVSTENLLPDFDGVTNASKLPPTGAVTRYQPGDVLISNIRPYLKKIWQADRDGGASNDVVVVRACESISRKYLSIILKNDAFVTYVMGSAKGLKMPRGDVDSMREYAVPYPSPAEQQKIADCLTSLDEVMAAQGRNVEALKAHKKGLMQQLFPREGETLPRLRFPEFRDGPEWEARQLGELVEINSGNSPSHYALSNKGEYPFVKVEELNNCVKYQIGAREYSDDADGLIPPQSLIFPKRGAAIALNKIRISSRNILMDTNMMALTPTGACRAEFLFYCISQIGLDQIADSSTIPQINNKHIIPFKVSVPSPEEQQQIADCLSALDARITAEAKKLVVLKTHKRGLMQQLFPPPGDC